MGLVYMGDDLPVDVLLEKAEMSRDVVVRAGR